MRKWGGEIGSPLWPGSCGVTAGGGVVEGGCSKEGWWSETEITGLAIWGKRKTGVRAGGVGGGMGDEISEGEGARHGVAGAVSVGAELVKRWQRKDADVHA